MTPSQFRILSQDFDRIVSTLGDRLNIVSGSTIVITGCCGLIGSYFVDLFAYLNISLFKNPVKIIGIDNGLVGKWDRIEHLNGRSDVKIIKSDLGGVEFDYHVDWLINAAGVASPVLYKQFPVQTMQATVLGLWNLLEHRFDGLSGLLHFSSSEVYSDPDILPTPETYVGRVSTIGPRSSYDSSKCFSETLCRIYYEQFGVPVKIVRPFNVYGAGHRLDDGRIIPQLMKSLMTGEKFPIHGDGSATRSYCYLSDAATQLLAVLLDGQNGEVYNVGDGTSEISVADLVKTAQEIFDGKPEVEFFEDKSPLTDAPTRRRPDVSKVLKLVSAPEVGLKEGLVRTFEWHRGEG